VNPRDRILGRVRSALAGLERTPHPGSFGEWRPDSPPPSPVDGFATLFEAAGGEVVRRATLSEAAAWLDSFTSGFDGAAVGATLPTELRPCIPDTPAETAGLGVSMARGGVAETGSLILDARDGRGAQLLAPTHVVFVRARDVYATLREALVATADDLPSAIGLHSGPSKSADIGQILVKGVHGPGRLIAVVFGE